MPTDNNPEAEEKEMKAQPQITLTESESSSTLSKAHPSVPPLLLSAVKQPEKPKVVQSQQLQPPHNPIHKPKSARGKSEPPKLV